VLRTYAQVAMLAHTLVEEASVMPMSCCSKSHGLAQGPCLQITVSASKGTLYG